MNLNLFKTEDSEVFYTEGEEFLKDFFNSENIGFEFQKVIPRLRSDNKSFRQADFYLPKYKIYLEFFGSWNTSDVKRDEYRKKVAAYESNKIPCIYIYPENLGIIHYIFNKRIRSTLKKYELRKELFKFNLSQFLKNDGALPFWIGFGILIVILNFFDDKPGTNWKWIIGSFVVTCYLIYCLWKSYRKHFKRGYSYVDFFH